MATKPATYDDVFLLGKTIFPDEASFISWVNAPNHKLPQLAEGIYHSPLSAIFHPESRDTIINLILEKRWKKST